ncbi:NAD-dependent protein deacetylase [Vallicoccus soli]|uniref:NAD-dependent protein deacetylase n=1 Tax=Vallicoccus soli TaxID=2339232 RepID=A0A3A3ZMR8_9ACTN|nr:NAD-dependent protein deacetylase [Vallicoccus soli]RJK97991.1 NAD-dependent protein deacetylase [Vallicoccus soli]
MSEAGPRGDLEALAGLVADGGAVVLSGAGLSTESGIPDYRGPSGSRRTTAPMRFQVFVGDPVARRRYWARSHVGWPYFSSARPNDGHRAVAELERAGLLRGIVTQNVDGLHQAAGARDVVDLHGRLDRVVCLRCGAHVSREEVERRLTEANPGFGARARVVNADGDAEIDETDLDGFHVVGCGVCGQGPLKPDVVYFGETVPRERVERSYALVEGASCLLVLGSSLTVMSGYRFVLRAADRGIPVAVVNQGPTRGDAHAEVRLDAPLGRVLPALAARLVPART